MALKLKGNRKYPTIPPVKHDLANHTDTIMAIKEAMEVGQRRTNNLFYSFITVQDLLDLGLIDLKGNTQSIVGADLSQIANIGDLSGSATGDFLRYNGTVWINDQIHLGDITQGMVTQHEAALTISWSQLTGIPPLGEANDGLNVGYGAGVFKDKVGLDLRFKTLVEGANITIVEDDDEITISGESGDVGQYREPMTDGDVDDPQILFSGGDFVFALRDLVT
jgi:hypothetical protein